MRRIFVLALAVIALVGMLAPGVYAQAPAAPAPTFKITGLIDTVTSTSHNMRDANYTRVGDKEWYSRNRGRFDITGQVGKAIGVLGLEIDTAWGQVTASETNTTTVAAAGSAQHLGTTSAFDSNTDTQGSIEVKWLYVEYDVPLVPFPTRMRIGAQPFATTYKLATLASGDFAGVNLVTTWAPNVKSNFTYVQFEEELTGGTTGGGAAGFGRGDDFAIITSLEVTPIKGLDLRPTYAVLWGQGAAIGATRNAVGGLVGAGGTPTFAARMAGGVATHEEWRHTIGIDARWRSGPLSIEPTFFYQFGTRDIDNPFPIGTTDLTRESSISAYLFDLKAGYRVGPVLLEARYMYTSGNRPMDQLSNDTNYYQPISTDTSYFADGWGNIFALGIDYLGSASFAYRSLGSAIGMDRYGRQQFGFKATYSVSPQLDIYGLVTPAWTAKSVDTDGTFAAGVMNCTTHSANSMATPRGAGCRGDSSYLGTEADLGLTWRFAPGLTFDLVGAYLFAGDALDTTNVVNGVATRRGSEDAYTGAARVRFSF